MPNKIHFQVHDKRDKCTFFSQARRSTMDPTLSLNRSEFEVQSKRNLLSHFGLLAGVEI
jgi:hypothetical protein